MSQKTLTVVTGNKSKAGEIEAITDWPVQAVSLDIAEIQSLDVQEVARAKAMSAYELLRKPVVVDDTGMSIEALNGLPGALVSWFLDNLGPEGILKLVERQSNRRASVSTCIGYADENGPRTFLGTINGRLAHECRGSHGFGYDPIFIPGGQDRTYAEMTPEEKNSHSMRMEALARFKEFLLSMAV